MSTSCYERYWAGRAGEELSGIDFALKWPKLRPHVPQVAGAVIVDFGCGNGQYIREMAALNPRARYIGLDVSEAALAAASAGCPRAEFHRIADGGKFALPSASADFVFSSEVIEHVYDTENAFAEVARILRPGGRLLLTTPHHGLIKNLLIVLTSFDHHFDPTGPHVRFFSKASLFACLRRAGLEPVQTDYYGRFYPLSHSIIVLAEKGAAQRA